MPDNTKKWYQATWFTVLAIFLAFVSCSAFLLWYYSNHIGRGISKNSQDWANFATYYTGIISPIVTTVGLYFIIRTFRLQQEQLNKLENQDKFNLVLSSLDKMKKTISENINYNFKKEINIFLFFERVKAEDYFIINSEIYLKTIKTINKFLVIIDDAVGKNIDKTPKEALIELLFDGSLENSRKGVIELLNMEKNGSFWEKYKTSKKLKYIDIDSPLENFLEETIEKHKRDVFNELITTLQDFLKLTSTSEAENKTVTA
jgi:hypothetical protein